ncbi:MAG TPA: helix-turn-helix domain-containing protein [Roseiarcus sp.]|nr:helix-turn-helix domain-containing protein [Roseiarcus sp.]
MERLAEAGHADRVLKAIMGSEAASSPIVASWQRSSALHALDPETVAPSWRLPSPEVASARERLGRLLHVAEPSLERLFFAVGGVGCSVILADRDGVILERRGASSDDSVFDNCGLWTGAIWSEKFEGTNGIGTCLFEQRTVTIDRDQHFFARNSLLCCTSAPIFDERGELAAVLDVSSNRRAPGFLERAHDGPGFANLVASAVSDAARSIEAENFRLAYPRARIVVAPGGERLGAARLAIDRDDLVIGATRAARLVLGINAQTLARPTPAADLIDSAAADGDDIEAAERAVLQRALARSGGNVSKAAKRLDFSRATLHRKMSRLGLKH